MTQSAVCDDCVAKVMAEAEQKPNDEQRKQELERLTREQRELQQHVSELG